MDKPEDIDAPQDAEAGRSTIEMLTEACLVLAQSTQQLVDVMSAVVAKEER